MLPQDLLNSIDQEIQTINPAWFGTKNILPVSGGDINQSFRLSDGNLCYFLKVNTANCLPVFEAETFALQMIAASDTIRVPECMLSGQHRSLSFLIMEFLPLQAIAVADSAMQKFGQQLARMHLLSSKTFGFPVDNFIGSNHQPNEQMNDWLKFFSEQRLQYQFSLSTDFCNDNQLTTQFHLLLDNIGYFFDGYKPIPSLIHGDLWSGNWGFLSTEENTPVIFDPASYFADHEMELAMMELFGNPGKVFFNAYAQIFPIDQGYSQRRSLYQLYHILNHANLFGGSYIEQAKQRIFRLAQKIQ